MIPEGTSTSRVVNAELFGVPGRVSDFEGRAFLLAGSFGSEGLATRSCKKPSHAQTGVWFQQTRYPGVHLCRGPLWELSPADSLSPAN